MASVRATSENLACRLGPSAVGHHLVQDDRVGAPGHGKLDDLLDAAGGPDKLESVGTFDHPFDHAPRKWIIIRGCDSQGRAFTLRRMRGSSVHRLDRTGVAGLRGLETGADRVCGLRQSPTDLWLDARRNIGFALVASPDHLVTEVGHSATPALTAGSFSSSAMRRRESMSRALAARHSAGRYSDACQTNVSAAVAVWAAIIPVVGPRGGLSRGVSTAPVAGVLGWLWGEDGGLGCASVRASSPSFVHSAASESRRSGLAMWWSIPAARHT